MNTLTAVVDTLATDSMVAENVQEGLNVLDLAMKGGWIMIVLALLSVWRCRSGMPFLPCSPIGNRRRCGG